MPKSLVVGEASGCTEVVHFRSNSMNGRNGAIFVDPYPALKVWLQYIPEVSWMLSMGKFEAHSKR
jgi:hypothetical protein